MAPQEQTALNFFKVLRSLKVFLGIFIFCFVLAGFVAAFQVPLLFKYATSLVTVDSFEQESNITPRPSMSNEDKSKLSQLAFGIPFLSDNQQIYDVSFEHKFQLSVVKGDGNCSNHIGSISWYLIKEVGTKDFNIVHFFSKQSFIKGYGHTVIDAGGIYDVFDGGVWVDSDGGLLGLTDIVLSSASSDSSEFRMKTLNAHREDKNQNYVASVLGERIIGVTPAETYGDYVNFIDAIYFPFIKNKEMEKHLYDGLAMFFGKLPVVYVEGDLRELVGHYFFPIKLAKLWIYSLRAAVALLSFWFLFGVYKTFSKL